MKNVRILVIHKRSTYSEMVANDSVSPVHQLVRNSDPVVAPIMVAHDAHTESMGRVRQVFEERGIEATWRHDLSGLIPDSFHLVVTVGGDGTILHASHAIGRTPVLGINSSPTTSVGYFTVGAHDSFARALDDFLAGRLQTTTFFRMEVKVNGEVVNSRVLNDVLFCHECPASTTRYKLIHDDFEETQMSSGVWIATAAGSTAAIAAAGGTAMASGVADLQYVVREPGLSAGEGRMTMPVRKTGIVSTESTFAIQSRSAAARLYIDGPHVAIPVNFGDIVTFTGGSSPIHLASRLTENKT